MKRTKNNIIVQTVLSEVLRHLEHIQQGDQHPLKQPVVDDSFDTPRWDSWTLSESTALWGSWSFFLQQRQIPAWHPPMAFVLENRGSVDVEKSVEATRTTRKYGYDELYGQAPCKSSPLASSQYRVDPMLKRPNNRFDSQIRFGEYSYCYSCERNVITTSLDFVVVLS